MVKNSPLVEEKRITVVAARRQSLYDWETVAQFDSHLVLLSGPEAILDFFASEPELLGYEISRIIVDRACDAREFLTILCRLPRSFRGDVLMLESENGGFLSAIGRGDDRVLYELDAEDAEFYTSTVLTISPQRRPGTGLLRVVKNIQHARVARIA